MEIIFTNTSGFNDLENPKSSSTYIPEWYKNIESYTSGQKKPNGNAGTTATIKKCMPVFDAITAGYIIESPADVWVSIKEYEAIDSETKEKIKDLPVKKMQHFEWSNFGLISFHPIQQALNHPLQNEHAYPKWMNPWSIKTPKGYSTLFVQPFHRESIFTILPGIVDTDTYYATVNFPFVINDPNFEGLIPKGTPIAQVIPFKRDSWNIKIGDNKDLQNQNNISIKLQNVFFDRYKKMFWNKKEYR